VWGKKEEGICIGRWEKTREEGKIGKKNSPSTERSNFFEKISLFGLATGRKGREWAAEGDPKRREQGRAIGKTPGGNG